MFVIKTINRNKTNYGAILTIYFVHVTEQRYHFHLIVGCGFIVIKQFCEYQYYIYIGMQIIQKIDG